MFIHGSFSAIRVRDHSSGKVKISGLLYILSDRGNQPQCIIRTYIFDSVYNIFFMDPRYDRRGTERLFVSLLHRFEPSRLEQMKAVSL